MDICIAIHNHSAYNKSPNKYPPDWHEPNYSPTYRQNDTVYWGLFGVIAIKEKNEF